MGKNQIIIDKVVCTLRAAFQKGSTIDDKKFAFEVAADCYCTERKAKEYIKIARVLFARELATGRSQIQNNEDTVDGTPC